MNDQPISLYVVAEPDLSGMYMFDVFLLILLALCVLGYVLNILRLLGLLLRRRSSYGTGEGDFVLFGLRVFGIWMPIVGMFLGYVGNGRRHRER